MSDTEYRTTGGYQKTYNTKDAVISSGQSLSSVVDLEQLNITGLLIPSSWTTAKITFQVSPDGTTFGDLNDASGNELQLTVAAGKFIGVNLAELSGARFIKVRSGTSGAAVNQAADRTISIVLTSNAEASATATGGGAATIADGADVNAGATTDAAVTSDANGTLSAKLRGIIKILVDFWDATNHRLLTANAPRLNKVFQQTTITNTNETTIATAVASTYLDLFRLIISNTSTTDTVVTIKDATAGTTRYVFSVKAGATVGFSGPVDAAANQSAVNNNWTATCSVGVSSIQISTGCVKNS